MSSDVTLRGYLERFPPENEFPVYSKQWIFAKHTNLKYTNKERDILFGLDSEVLYRHIQRIPNIPRSNIDINIASYIHEKIYFEPSGIDIIYNICPPVVDLLMYYRDVVGNRSTLDLIQTTSNQLNYLTNSDNNSDIRTNLNNLIKVIGLQSTRVILLNVIYSNILNALTIAKAPLDTINLLIMNKTFVETHIKNFSKVS